MPNALSITDGTTTISLSSSGCLLTHYVPQGTASTAVVDEKPLTETIEFVITASDGAAVQAALNAIERLLTQAIDRSGSRERRPYLTFQAHSDAVARRSEILSYQLLLDDDAPVQLVQLMLGVRLIVTRAPWWEVATETDAGTIYIYNGDAVGEPDVGGWIGPTGPITYSAAFAADEGDNAYNAGEWANIEGVLPTPAHVTLTNGKGSSVAVKRIYIANDIYARFDGSQHYLSSGATVSWTGSSTHATARWTLTPTAAQIAKIVAAGGVRLLGVFASASASVYLRAALYQNTPGSVLAEAWRGPEMLTTAARKVYDLGFMPAPPEATTFTDWRIIISVFAAASGAANLDFLQLCPGRELIVLESAVGVAWENGAVLDWWGDQRYAAIAGYHGSLIASGRLLLQPQRQNRLQVLAESTSGVDTTMPIRVAVQYRPRRATI